MSVLVTDIELLIEVDVGNNTVTLLAELASIVGSF